MAHATTVPCSTSLAAHCRHAAPSPSASVPPRRTILHEGPQSPRQQRPKEFEWPHALATPRGGTRRIVSDITLCDRYSQSSPRGGPSRRISPVPLWQSPRERPRAPGSQGSCPCTFRLLEAGFPPFLLSPRKRKTPRTSLPPHPAQATEGDRRLETGPARGVITSIRQASINTSSTGPVRLETMCGQGPAVARHGPWR